MPTTEQITEEYKKKFLSNLFEGSWNEPLTGLASELAGMVNDEVERTHYQPVPMTTIQALARTLVRAQDVSDIFKTYLERHYYEYSQWFIHFRFVDGSSITFGDSEDI